MVICFFSLVGLIILALKTALRYISSFSNDVLAASEVHYCRAAPVTAFRNPVFSREYWQRNTLFPLETVYRTVLLSPL